MIFAVLAHPVVRIRLEVRQVPFCRLESRQRLTAWHPITMRVRILVVLAYGFPYGRDLFAKFPGNLPLSVPYEAKHE